MQQVLSYMIDQNLKEYHLIFILVSEMTFFFVSVKSCHISLCSLYVKKSANVVLEHDLHFALQNNLEIEIKNMIIITTYISKLVFKGPG